jgi:hypothetical protein
MRGFAYEESIETIVIGRGQAGLATSYLGLETLAVLAWRDTNDSAEDFAEVALIDEARFGRWPR